MSGLVLLDTGPRACLVLCIGSTIWALISRDRLKSAREERIPEKEQVKLRRQARNAVIVLAVSGLAGVVLWWWKQKQRVEQSNALVKQKPAQIEQALTEEQSNILVKQKPQIEQALALEQKPAQIEQALTESVQKQRVEQSNVVKQRPAQIEQALALLKQKPAQIEQALALVKQKPAQIEQALTESVQKQRVEQSNALVKQKPAQIDQALAESKQRVEQSNVFVKQKLAQVEQALTESVQEQRVTEVRGQETGQEQALLQAQLEGTQRKIKQLNTQVTDLQNVIQRTARAEHTESWVVVENDSSETVHIKGENPMGSLAAPATDTLIPPGGVTLVSGGRTSYGIGGGVRVTCDDVTLGTKSHGTVS